MIDALTRMNSTSSIMVELFINLLKGKHMNNYNEEDRGFISDDYEPLKDPEWDI